jgi:hypothetical protein
MKNKNIIQKFIKFNEQLDNHTEKERLEYERGIELYTQALKHIDEAISIFTNSPWGVPEELDMLFGERQGNETLYSLQKEVNNLKEELNLNESNFVTFDKVDKPKFDIDEVVIVLFKESRWKRSSTPYIAKVLDIEKRIGINMNEYFRYELEIIEPHTNAPDFYNTESFKRKKGDIVSNTESNILKY